MEKWLWCNRCHRAYPEHEARIKSGMYHGYRKYTSKRCKYDDCNGSMIQDGQDYFKMRFKIGRKTWPIYPQRERVYRPEVAD